MEESCETTYRDQLEKKNTDLSQIEDLGAFKELNPINLLLFPSVIIWNTVNPHCSAISGTDIKSHYKQVLTK